MRGGHRDFAGPTTEEQLDDELTRPSPALVEDLADLAGDLVVLGAGGKMGPSLCRLARRGLDAAGRDDRRVVAVSRWTDHERCAVLDAAGVVTVAADLDDASEVAGLPDASDVVFLAGSKFGTAGNEHRTWATNVLLPARAVERYAGARIAAFSTGNVYPMVPIGRGCREDTPVAPVGEYAMSCLGRERIVEHVSSTRGARTSLLRLNYAVDLRYGVLADVARAIRDGDPIDLTTGFFNAVWQNYANEVALRSLRRADSPPWVLNVTGPELGSVRDVAQRLGERLGVAPRFAGQEEPTALLNDASLCHALFGRPAVSLTELIDWQAGWLLSGGSLWDKPTKFQVRDGRF